MLAARSRRTATRRIFGRCNLLIDVESEPSGLFPLYILVHTYHSTPALTSSVAPPHDSAAAASTNRPTTVTRRSPTIFGALKRSVGLTPSVSFQRVPSSTHDINAEPDQQQQLKHKRSFSGATLKRSLSTTARLLTNSKSASVNLVAAAITDSTAAMAGDNTHIFAELVLEDKKGRVRERFPMTRAIISIGR